MTEQKNTPEHNEQPLVKMATSNKTTARPDAGSETTSATELSERQGSPHSTADTEHSANTQRKPLQHGSTPTEQCPAHICSLRTQSAACRRGTRTARLLG